MLKTQAQVKRIILPVLKKHGVLKSAIFGSFAFDKPRRNSDVDILVKMPPHSSLFDLASLQGDLKEKLKRDVDLVTYDSVHPRLKEIIFSHAQTVL
jgi:predicted nucleotidyltransferase